MKHETASVPTAEQMVALAARMVQQLGPMHHDLDGERVKYWLSGGGAELGAKLQRMLLWDRQRALVSWEAFYKVFFGLETLLAAPGCGPKFKIPAWQPGFDRLIVVAPDITLEQVIEACQKYFSVAVNLPRTEGKYEKWLASLEDDRDPAEAGYAILVRDSNEADPGLAKKSADQLAAEKIPGMTMLERLLFELKYYSETGSHLDRAYRPRDGYDFSFPLPSMHHSRTLVTGTHNDSCWNDDSPHRDMYWSVCWRDCTHVFIDWTHSGAAGFGLSSRQVICAE